MKSFQPFFEAVRSACSSATWSSGVQLVRAEAVHIEQKDTDEIQLRVATRGGLISPAVTLYIVDRDWECDCASSEDACEHVAASTITVRSALREGRDLNAQTHTAARLGYRLARKGSSSLALEREIVRGADTYVLETTLSAIASGRIAGPGFVATPADLQLEHALGTRLRGVMTREMLPRLLDALAHCADVQLDGEPIEVSSERLPPRGEVRDAPGGFLVRVQLDPRIDEIFETNVARCKQTLHVMASGNLTGREREEFSRGHFYSDENAAHLATEILPSLMERIPIEIHSQRLPRTTSDARPRIQIEVERRDDSLCVFPTLVYGDPVLARIDAGKMVHLGESVPVRDREAERACVRQLQTATGLATGHRVTFTGSEALKIADQLQNWPGKIQGTSHLQFQRLPELTAELQITTHGFDLRFESHADTTAPSTSVDPGKVLQAWRDGESFVSVGSAGLAPLPSDWLARFGQRIADLLAARDARGQIATHALPDLGRICDDLDQPRPPELKRLAPLLEGFESLPHTPAPEDLQTTLRSYQTQGVDWLHFMREAGLGALLADDMGLGKTLQALCAVQGRTLVIAPTSVLQCWREEVERHRPSLSCALYHGSSRQLDPSANVILTSYAVLRLDIEALGLEHWDLVILDEAQAIKNPESQTAQAAYRLQARFRMALTGTPVENRLDELWSQLHFLNRGLLGGRSDFARNTSGPIARGEPGAAERLRERIKPFVLRRIKRDVAPELPPRTEVTLHVELTQPERDVYDSIRAATRKRVIEQLAGGGSVMAALEALLRLRQAACHIDLVPGQSAASSSKVETLLERLEQAVADGHKALVFSQWTSLLDRVEPGLEQAEMAFTRLDGSTRDRAAVVTQFQDPDGPPVMLLSLKAGGSGLTLTQADHVFLLDPWWNPAVEDQAADRAHRIGQDRPVVIHRLVAAQTVEERILELQTAKRATAEAALGGASQAAGITRDDLLALLQ